MKRSLFNKAPDMYICKLPPVKKISKTVLLADELKIQKYSLCLNFLLFVLQAIDGGKDHCSEAVGQNIFLGIPLITLTAEKCRPSFRCRKYGGENVEGRRFS